jgi:hypothetical protein
MIRQVFSDQPRVGVVAATRAVRDDDSNVLLGVRGGVASAIAAASAVTATPAIAASAIASAVTSVAAVARTAGECDTATSK